MADHDAKVRLNLAAAGMLSMLQELSKQSAQLAENIEGIGEESKKSEKKIHPMLASAKKGFGEARSAVADLGGQLKSAIGQAATLGGMLSAGAGMKTAVDLVSHYKDIAFAIRTGTGEAMQWEQVQQKVEKTANRWKQSNGDVAKSFDMLFREANDVDFADKATEASAKFARATGKSMELYAGVADELRDKFGVAAGDIEEAMAVIASTNKVEEFAGSMDRLGASARSLGLQGKEGLSQLVGMLEASGGATKDLKKGISGLSQAMESLEDPERAGAIEKALKVKLRTDDGQLKKDALEQLLKASGGQKEVLAKVFSGDALKIMTEYGRIYSAAFDSTAGNFKAKSEAGMDAFNKAIADAGRNKLSVKALTGEAEDRNKDPKAQLQDAMNRFTSAFAQPKLISAVNKLADKAPAIADVFAKLVDFATDHPLLAGAGLVGAKGGMAFGQSMAGDGMDWLMGAAKKKLAKKFGAAEAADAGGEMAKAASLSPAWKTAGMALGVAAAGLVAYELGKAGIDAWMNNKEEDQKKTFDLGMEASGAAASGDLAKMQEARQRLAERVAQYDEDKNSFLHRIGRGIGRTVEGDDFKTADDRYREQAKKDLAALDAAITAATPSTDKATAANERFAAAAEKAAKALDRLGGSGGGGNGTNGLPPLGGGTT